MKQIFLLLMLSLSLFAQMNFSDPQPSFEAPRKWVIRISTNDLATMNHTLDTVNNVLKEYPPESLKVALVFYSKGVRVIKKDFDATTLARIKSLMAYEIELIACQNTMESMGWQTGDFIEGVSYVQAGVAEVIERVAHGWIDVTPY
ncbi:MULTISPECIES: DsrE family protein [unclassified Sulfurospirillum]|uniref:DsrE family protein n=1 Tax=unclassified Sulfurospirillum TaxID=2618290 RepID=UPI0005060415|nr:MULTISPECIES: DsrE family protein [unclassified Sulfurospirillum]KFL32997.1 hypothetical protein JU57_13490 [Sulfurospirillum sp. SCADC]